MTGRIASGRDARSGGSGLRKGRGRARALAAVLIVAAGGFLAPGKAGAQGAEDTGFPGWMERWAPLRLIGEIPVRLPSAPEPASLLFAPERRIGLFWTAGNPAALPAELERGWTAFALRRGSEDGDFHRPLDPRAATSDRLSGLSWKRLGGDAAAIGQAVVEQELRSPASFATAALPYRGTPFVTTDTGAVTDTRRVRVRLQGAAGYELGPWGVGLAVGYEAIDARTREDPVPRSLLVSSPAVTLGVARGLAGGDLRIAVHGRWHGDSEELFLWPDDGVTRVHLLRGLREPTPRDLIRLPPFFRRTDRDAYAAGAGLQGSLGGFRWVVFGEGTRLEETQALRAAAEEGQDRWETDGSRLGAALQRPLSDRWLLTVAGRRTALSGEATEPDVAEVVYRAEETLLSVSAEARLLPAEPGWGAALRVGLDREARDRIDRFAEVSSHLLSWRKWASLEVARTLGARVAVSGSYGIALDDATATMPDPSTRGEVYRRLIAPALLLSASSATSHGGTLHLRWRTSGSTALWTRAGLSSASPRDLPARGAFTPGGDRTAWSLSAGVELGG